MVCLAHLEYTVFHIEHSPRHIDGHDYMYALSEILESAREAIFILVSLSDDDQCFAPHDKPSGLVAYA